LGIVLFLTGGLLMGSSAATIPPTPLAGCTGGCGPPAWIAWIVLTKPVVGIFLIVLGLFIMFRADRKDDVSEEGIPRSMDGSRSSLGHGL
jgi:hypothetical protein